MSDLVELVIKDLTQTMRNTLAPVIEKIESTTKQYQTLIDIMTNMPEFKELLQENIRLKEELNKKIESGSSVTAITVPAVPVPFVEPNDHVTLAITDTKIVTINVTEHVKDIYDTVNKLTTEEEEASEVEQEDASEAEEEAASVADVEQEAASEAEEEAASEAEEAEEEEEASEAEEEEAEEEEAIEAEQEEAEEEASEVEEEASEADEDEEAEESEEVFVIEIDGVDYYTSNENTGIIYKIDENEEVGDKVGQFVDGEPIML